MRRQLSTRDQHSPTTLRAQLAASLTRFATVTLSAAGAMLALWLFSGLLAPGAAATVPPLVASTHNVTKTAATKTEGGDGKKRPIYKKGQPYQVVGNKRPVGRQGKPVMMMKGPKAGVAKLVTDGSTPGSKKYWDERNDGAKKYWAARAERVKKYRDGLKPVKGQAGRDRAARHDLVDDQRGLRQDIAKAQRAAREKAANGLRALNTDPKFRKAYMDAMRANDKNAMAALRAQHAAQLDAVRQKHAAELAARRAERAAKGNGTGGALAPAEPAAPATAPAEPTAPAAPQAGQMTDTQKAAVATAVTVAVAKAADGWLAKLDAATQKLRQWVANVKAAVAAIQHKSS